MHPEPRAQGSLEKRLFKVTESSFFSLSSLKWKIPDINSRNLLRPTSLSSVFNTRGNQQWRATFRQWAMNLVFLSTKSEIQTCCFTRQRRKRYVFFSPSLLISDHPMKLRSACPGFQIKINLYLFKRSEAYSLIQVCSFWAVSSPSLEKQVRRGPWMDYDLSCREVKCHD